MSRGTLTFALMDPPVDAVRTTIAMRLIALAVRRGHDVNVFAYEGAPDEGSHAARDGGSAPGSEWIATLMREATAKGVKVDWVDCGPERDGVASTVGVRRGSHADFWDMAANSHNMLVVPTG